MSDKEKATIIEEHIPSLQSIIDEYKAQGKTLTTTEAEAVREQLRRDMTAGHVDARDDVLGDDVIEKITGGTGGSPEPTRRVQGPTETISLSYFRPME